MYLIIITKLLYYICDKNLLFYNENKLLFFIKLSDFFPSECTALQTPLHATNRHILNPYNILNLEPC